MKDTSESNPAAASWPRWVGVKHDRQLLTPASSTTPLLTGHPNILYNIPPLLTPAPSNPPLVTPTPSTTPPTSHPNTLHSIPHWSPQHHPSPLVIPAPPHTCCALHVLPGNEDKVVRWSCPSPHRQQHGSPPSTINDHYSRIITTITFITPSSVGHHHWLTIPPHDHRL